MTDLAATDATSSDASEGEVGADDQTDGASADGATDPAPTRRSWRERADAWAARVTLPQLVLVTIVVVYVWYFTERTIDIHHALGTASYDSGLYDQGIWLLSRFEAPFVTLMGRNLFGDHTSFVLLGLVPFYWIWPSAGVLFFSQSLAIGAGAIPVFLYGRRRLGNEWYALLAAAAYLTHPAIGWTNLENFHPDAFLGVFVGFAIYAALERKWRMYLLFVVLALSVKEDASLVLVPLGIWVGVKRSWRIGIATVVGSVAFMAVAMFVIMRSLIGVPTRNTWRLPFSQEGDSTIRAGLRVVDTAITNPTDLADHLRADDRPWYLWQMTAPFAWLFLRLPAVAAISGLVLFTNVLSTFWYQYQIEYHYALVAVPALSLGTVYAIGAIRERWEVRVEKTDRETTDLHDDLHDDDAVSIDGDRSAGEGPDERGPRRRSVVLPLRAIAMGVLVGTSLVTSHLWSPVPWGRTELFYGQPDNPWANGARDMIEQVPRDAVLSAHYRITPHTAHRREIYQFPTPFRAVLYGPDGILDGPRLPERAERVEYVILPVSTDAYPYADWLAIEEAFDVVDRNDYWILYERDFDVPLPPER